MYHQDVQTEANVTLIQSVVPQTAWYRFRGMLLFWWTRQSQVLHASPVSLASTQILSCGILKELLFLTDFYVERHTSYQPVSCLSSVSSFLFAHFDSAIVLFFVFLKGLHLVVKMDPLVVVVFFFLQRYNNECTPTDWNKTRTIFNSLWFNSLTLLPCYANSCGQSTTPPCWGLDR